MKGTDARCVWAREGLPGKCGSQWQGHMFRIQCDLGTCDETASACALAEDNFGDAWEAWSPEGEPASGGNVQRREVERESDEAVNSLHRAPPPLCRPRFFPVEPIVGPDVVVLVPGSRPVRWPVYVRPGAMEILEFQLLPRGPLFPNNLLYFVVGRGRIGWP